MLPPEEKRQLQTWDLAHVWHPFTQMAQYEQSEPLIIQRAAGCWLEDVDGRRYLDGVASIWCNLFGHRRAEIDRAILEQLGQVAHTTLLGISHVPAIRLARKLVELAAPLAQFGEPLTHVFFSDDGATAVEVALKMAFQYWQQRPHHLGGPKPRKTKFVSFGGAYHGDTLGDVSVGGVELFHRVFGPLLFPTYRAPQPYCYRCPLGLRRESCALDCAAECERLLAEQHEEIAAVVIEPLVQGAAGMIVAPEGFLRRIREATRRYDVLLIADEVAVGLGRTGTLFACQQEQVAPDFLCLAKGLTGGYLPLAVTLTNQRIYQAFIGSIAERRTFFHGHTYSGNPLGAAAALATLELFEKERILEKLPPRIAQLTEWCERFRQLPHVGDVRQKGLLAGIELVRDKVSREPYPYESQIGHAVCRRARERGVLLRPLGHILVIFPPLVISEEELELLCQTLWWAIRDVTEK
ncbi:MAG: adenosylmethionine--8-amino-7-oxononanoate transaminase [Gemmatales bacterium]|nr:adenosylmethionine--8-amino-7-oxononanoate transaminase [Gemmatales bacterium]